MDVIWQDIAIALGSVVGIISKSYGLWDSSTVWSRASSLPNAVLYLPSIAAFLSLGLWITAVTATLNMCIWFGIALFRSKESTDD